MIKKKNLLFKSNSKYIIYIFDSHLVWQMQLMFRLRLKIRVVSVGNFEPLMLIN